MRRWWPLVVVLAFQIGALVVMPRRAASARAGTREITLRTEAVDPFDPLAGRFVILRYVVERVPDPPMDMKPERVVWLTVERASPAWELVRSSDELPDVDEDECALRARWARDATARIENAGRLYMSEEACLAADELLRANSGEGLVDLRVDERGNATPLRLRVGGRTFEP